MVVFKDNIDSLRENVKYLDSLGVSNIRVSSVFDQGEWLAYANEHGISIEEVYDKYLEYIPHYLNDRIHADISLGGLFRYNAKSKEVFSTFENKCNPDNENKYFLCKSLKQSFYITSTGKVLPCASMMSTVVEDNALNILKDDLKDIINSSYLYDIANKKAKDFLENNEKCNKCKYKYECLGGCRANAIAKHNNLFDYDDGVCTYFLGGYKEKKDKLLKELSIAK